MWVNDRIHYASGEESLKALAAQKPAEKDGRQTPALTLQDILKSVH